MISASKGVKREKQRQHDLSFGVSENKNDGDEIKELEKQRRTMRSELPRIQTHSQARPTTSCIFNYSWRTKFVQQIDVFSSSQRDVCQWHFVVREQLRAPVTLNRGDFTARKETRLKQWPVISSETFWFMSSSFTSVYVAF